MKKRPRKDELNAVIKRTYKALSAGGKRRPTAAEVLEKLPAYDEESCIDGVSASAVTWLDAHGKVRETTLGTLRNRLRDIRAGKR